MPDTPDRSGPGGRQISMPDLIHEHIQAGAAGAATGGWTAPLLGSLYDFLDLTPWTHPDPPWIDHIDIERMLFPRWTEWERTWSDLPRRVRMAWRVLRIGYSHHQEPL